MSDRDPFPSETRSAEDDDAPVLRHRIEADERPSSAAIDALTEVMVGAGAEVPALGRHVDPDAIDDLLSSPRGGSTACSVGFVVGEYEFEITGDEVVVTG
jgi:hypothetical protein